jgi:predicted Zn-dependent protease
MATPAQVPSERALVSEAEEIAYGNQAADEIIRRIGIYPDRALGEYVVQLGERVASSTERPYLPWRFYVLDDAAVNAFALPGGPVFVTRGLLSHLTSEAQLVTVLGHECGHVAEAHSVAMMSKAQVAELGRGFGTITQQGIATFRSAWPSGFQIVFLQYSQDAENRADEVGFRTAFGQGYDVRRTKDLFTELARALETESNGARLPPWSSTHPTETKPPPMTERLATAGDVDWNAREVGRDVIFSHLRDLTYGQDYRRGYKRNGSFFRPDLAFRIAFPAGWHVTVERDGAIATSPENDATAEIRMTSSTSPDEAMQRFWAAGEVHSLANAGGLLPLVLPSGRQGEPGRYFEARGERGALAGMVAFFETSGRTLAFIAYTAPDKLMGRDAAFRETLASFALQPEASWVNARPSRLEIVSVPRRMTLTEYNAQFASDIALDELAQINGISAETWLDRGDTIKRVTGGLAPSALPDLPGAPPRIPVPWVNHEGKNRPRVDGDADIPLRIRIHNDRRPRAQHPRD